MSDVERVGLSSEEAEELRKRLVEAGKPVHRSSKQNGSGPNARHRAVIEDIVEASRVGVGIAAHAESRPLVPLFAAASLPLPADVRVDHETMRYDFYFTELRFHTLFDSATFPSLAELELEIRDDGSEAARRVRPVRYFPGPRDRTYFQVDVEGAVGLDANMQLVVPLDAGAGVLPFAKLDAGVRARLVLGPWSFAFRRSEIEVSGEGDTTMRWRYQFQSRLAGTRDFKAMLVLKVPREIRRCSLLAKLSVVPCRRQWLIFRQVLPALTVERELAVELAPEVG